MTSTVSRGRRLLVGLAAAWLVAGLGCTRDEGGGSTSREVVVYVSADQRIATPMLQAFEEETGIAVRPLFDTEATKTTGLANRIRREADRPRADAFWSSEPFAVEQLAADGLLQPVSHPDLVDHPSQWRRADDRWFAFGGRARVVAFRPDRIEADALPATWRALADPRWRDEIAIADPRFGTTRGHFAALADSWGDAEYGSWLEGLVDNGVLVLPGGNAATVDAVVRGEVLLGCTDIDDVVAARRRGADVSAVLPRHDPEGVPGGGTLLLPNAVGMVTGTSRPEAAATLVAWLASAESEARLRASDSRNQPVAHPAVADEVVIPEEERFDEADPWHHSIEEVALAMDAAIALALDRLFDDGEDAGP